MVDRSSGNPDPASSKAERLRQARVEDEGLSGSDWGQIRRYEIALNFERFTSFVRRIPIRNFEPINPKQLLPPI